MTDGEDAERAGRWIVACVVAGIAVLCVLSFVAGRFFAR